VQLCSGCAQNHSLPLTPTLQPISQTWEYLAGQSFRGWDFTPGTLIYLKERKNRAAFCAARLRALRNPTHMYRLLSDHSYLSKVHAVIRERSAVEVESVGLLVRFESGDGGSKNQSLAHLLPIKIKAIGQRIQVLHGLANRSGRKPATWSEYRCLFVVSLEYFSIRARSMRSGWVWRWIGTFGWYQRYTSVISQTPTK
jgi:hypothetical protein